MNRKKWLFVIALFLLILLPTSVFATIECSTTVISGSASSRASSGGGGSTCSNGVLCVNTNGGTYTGVRIQIYKYTGSGSPTLVGQGVDIWATNALNDSSYHFSKPNNANLTNKTTCNSGLSYSSYISYSNYISGDYGVVTYDTQIKSKIFGDDFYKYLLTNDYSSGWVKTNILNKLAENSTSSRTYLKNLFNLTDSQLNDMIQNNGDYYIYAEVLYRFRNGSNYYLGTVSEATSTYGSWYDVMNALYIPTGQKIGKLVNDSITGTYKVQTVSALSGYAFHNTSEDITGKVRCGYAYGIAIWNISTVCEECTPSTCSTDCSAYAEGSSGRAVCASAWCNTNDPDNSSCVSACFNGTSLSCDSAYSNKCATYTDSSNQTSSTKNATCSSNTSTETSDVTLSTRTCFDAGTTTSDDTGETEYEYYSLTNTNYYKIECKETEKLTELPGKQNVYVSSTGSASLYLGYTKTYTKTCTLYYLNSSASSWTINYSNSKLKADLTTYENIKNGNISGSNLDDETREAMISEATTIYNELSKVKDRAIARLETVTAADYKISGTSKSDTATITYATSSTTSKTETVTMTPVYCFNKVNTSKKYCTLESNKWSKTTTSEIYCTDRASDGVVVDDTTATTSSTIYYSVPSSYLAVYSSEIGNAYRDLNTCKKATGSSDLCNEIEYAYAFSKITMPLSTYNSVIGSSAYTLSITGDGMCSQFTYNLTCDYDLVDDDDTSKTCDDYCGANTVCRAKYCPNECDGCDKIESGDCGDIETCEKKYCSSYSGDEYITCKYDTCCSNSCNGNVSCIYKCCTSTCEELYNSEDDITACKETCECPNGVCEDDYYYRTINRSDPFLENSDSTHVTGKNWKGNETYITEASGESDNTNDTSKYEYKIELSASTISAIKNQSTYSTVYSDYSLSTKASSVTNTSSDIKEYCSSFIYDYLYTTLGVQLEKSSDVGSKGCEIK